MDELKADEQLSKNKAAMQGLDEIRLLLQYCEHFRIQDKVKTGDRLDT